MSYYPSPAIVPTPGSAFEAFYPKTASLLIPQERYRPEAAGPKYLTMDGLGSVRYLERRSAVPANLRGLGADLPSVVAQSLDPIVQRIYDQNSAKFDKHLAERLTPVEYATALGAIASIVSAYFAYRCAKKMSR